jgi:hypothetical protein
MKKMLLIFLMVLSILAMPKPVLAQGNASEINRQLGAAAQSGNLGQPVDPRTTAANIIRIALSVIGTIFLALIVYAGFLWMTAGGSEEKVTTAKKLLFQAVIGLIIILSAYTITLFVFRTAVVSQYDQDQPGNYITAPQGVEIPY